MQIPLRILGHDLSQTVHDGLHFAPSSEDFPIKIRVRQLQCFGRLARRCGSPDRDETFGFGAVEYRQFDLDNACTQCRLPQPGRHGFWQKITDDHVG